MTTHFFFLLLFTPQLGEMTKLEGEANVRGRVAYVPQQAWMQNATLKGRESCRCFLSSKCTFSDGSWC